MRFNKKWQPLLCQSPLIFLKVNYCGRQPIGISSRENGSPCEAGWGVMRPDAIGVLIVLVDTFLMVVFAALSVAFFHQPRFTIGTTWLHSNYLNEWTLLTHCLCCWAAPRVGCSMCHQNPPPSKTWRHARGWRLQKERKCKSAKRETSCFNIEPLNQRSHSIYAEERGKGRTPMWSLG